MTAVQLAGIALAALLSENFILVSCLGIGSRTQAFQDPLDAWRTGYSLTAVMVLTALAAWVVNQLLRALALSYFQTLAFALDGSCGSQGCRIFCGPASRSCPGGWMRTWPLSPPTARLWAQRCSSPSGGTARAARSSTPCSAERAPRWP